MERDPTIIYLLGYPGTGKYTIGKEVCRQNPSYRLVDNHLISNPIFSIIHTDGITPLSPNVWENVEKIWHIVLDTIVNLSPTDYNFVLTNVLFDADGDKDWFKQIEYVAKARNSKFIPVLLRIDVAEHEKRIVQPERKDRMKEIDPKSPARYDLLNNLYVPDHPNLLTIDVTNLSADEAAKTILQYTSQVGQ